MKRRGGETHVSNDHFGMFGRKFGLDGLNLTLDEHLERYGTTREQYMERRDMGFSRPEAVRGETSGGRRIDDLIETIKNPLPPKKVIGYRFYHATSHSGYWIPVYGDEKPDGHTHMIIGGLHENE